MVRAKLFKCEKGLGNPLTPAERVKNFINNTSVEVLDVIVTSTRTYKPTSHEEGSWAQEILLVYREEENEFER